MGDCVLRFAATLPEYERAFGDLRCALDQHGVHAKGRYNVELVFEEIVTNIIRHGSSDGAQCAIEVALGFDDKVVVVSFHDDGKPFDPLEHADPELPQSVDSARVGGLGLMLVRKAATRMEYERTPQNRNRLIVTIAAA